MREGYKTKANYRETLPRQGRIWKFVLTFNIYLNIQNEIHNYGGSELHKSLLSRYHGPGVLVEW